MDKTFEESMQELVGNIRRLIHEEQSLSPFTVGEVVEMSETSIKIEADGMTLDKADLYLNEILLKGYLPRLTGTLVGTCSCELHTGKAVTPVKTGDLSRGEVALKKGDRVILQRSEDGQTYYVLAKAVRMP